MAAGLRANFERGTASKAATVVIIFLLSMMPLTLMITPGRTTAEGDEIKFTILHTNDEHSSLIPHSPAVDYDPEEPDDPTRGGFSRLATAIDEIRSEKEEEGEEVLLLNAGDFLGGTSFGWLAPEEGHAVELELLQEMGYDATTIGNHEYDCGTDVLARYLKDAGYPEKHEETTVLASNTEADDDHPLSEDLYRDTALFELEEGLTIGTFALIGEHAIRVTGDTGGVEFTEQHETAELMVERLEENGADVVVALSHSGVEEDRELARSVDGIDIIVGSHSHTPLHEPLRESGTIIVQADSYTDYLGRLELAYEDGEVRTINGVEGNDFLIPIDARFEPDQEISGLVDNYRGEVNELISEKTNGRFDDIKETVATSDFEIKDYPSKEETNMGNFITDGMRLVTGNVTGEPVDVAVQANGNIRGSVVPGSMPYSKGNISFYDLTGAVGLGYGEDGYAGYPMVSFYLTGEELYRVLEMAVLLEVLMSDDFFFQFSGLRYEYNPTNAVLFNLPFSETPLPSSRAVTSVELYTGEGVQTTETGGDEYVSLERDDENLYHVATDSHILSFLPAVSEIYSKLEVEPKNAEGESLEEEDWDEFTVHREDGTELKVWETVVEHAASQPEGEDGTPEIPEYYSETSGRINQVWSFPYIWLVYLALILTAGGVVLLIRRWRAKKEDGEEECSEEED
ncbi:MAG: bifunctional metallophosphatase/5'-nucleotidase [Candidatus Aenigmatarchaeota archaeon]